MPKNYDPTEGMSKLDMLLAGIGQGMNNTASGVGQSLGLLSKEDIAEKRRLDGPLLNQDMGGLGSILGSTAAMAPTALIPGANTLMGASLLGGGMGLLQPSVSDDETAKNALVFGLLGPASISAGRALGAIGGMAKPRLEYSR